MLAAIAWPAYAGCTTNTIGGTAYHNCTDGTSGTSRSIGGTTYHQFNDGDQWHVPRNWRHRVLSKRNVAVDWRYGISQL